MSPKRLKQLTNAAFNCYREMYAACDPPADFDKLYEEAPIDKDGRKEIKFLEHEMDQEKFDEILEKYLNDKTLKLKPYEKRDFSISINLGCSPKCKRKTSI
jgi:hypothetical protein